MDLTRFNENFRIYEDDAVDELDYLSNHAYKTYRAKPIYDLIVLLYYILPKDILRIIINFSFHKIDFNNRTIRRLNNSIKSLSLDEFKFIYDFEYICNPNIMNFFEFIAPFGNEFDDPSYICKWNIYDFCNCHHCCIGNNYCNKCSPEKLSKKYYIKSCNCQNGKRYLAFFTIYRLINNATFLMIKKNGINKNNIYISEELEVLNIMREYVIKSGPIDIEYLPSFNIPSFDINDL